MGLLAERIVFYCWFFVCNFRIIFYLYHYVSDIGSSFCVYFLFATSDEDSLYGVWEGNGPREAGLEGDLMGRGPGQVMGKRKQPKARHWL